MNFNVRRWRIALRVLVLALIVSATPWPCLAQQPGQPAARPGIMASVQPVVHGVASARTPARSQAQGAQDPRAQLESKSFFKTTAGAVVLAVVAAGVGYAFYSARHDRITPNTNR